MSKSGPAASNKRHEASRAAHSVATIFGTSYREVPYEPLVDYPASPYEAPSGYKQEQLSWKTDPGKPTTQTVIQQDTQPVSQPASECEPIGDNWCFAIAVTLFCFPLGIVAIVFSCLARKARRENRPGDAKEHVRSSFIASWVGLLGLVAIFIAYCMYGYYANHGIHW